MAQECLVIRQIDQAPPRVALTTFISIDGNRNIREQYVQLISTNRHRHIWYTLSYRRVLTGSNHHVNLLAGFVAAFNIKQNVINKVKDLAS